MTTDAMIRYINTAMTTQFRRPGRFRLMLDEWGAVADQTSADGLQGTWHTAELTGRWFARRNKIFAFEACSTADELTGQQGLDRLVEQVAYGMGQPNWVGGRAEWSLFDRVVSIRLPVQPPHRVVALVVTHRRHQDFFRVG